MKTRDMTQGRPMRLILSVALPLMAGSIFQQIYTIADASIVGRVDGVTALAALGTSDWYSWMFLAIIQGLAQGFAIPVAQAFGARDHKRLRKYTGSIIFMTAIYCIAVTLLAELTIHPVLALLDAPEEVRPIAADYLIFLFLGNPFIMLYNAMSAILRSLGDGRSPFIAITAASVLNIGLDLLFVAVFGWGVIGAAVATVIAQVVSCVLCFMALRKIDFIRPSRAELKPDRECCVTMLKLGLPNALQNMLVASGGMVLQSIANSMGVEFMAGFTATNKTYGALELAAIAYGSATTTYVGQNKGAGRHERIRGGVREAIFTGLATAGIIMAIMFPLGKGVISLFMSGDAAQVAQAMQLGWEYMRTLLIMLPVLYLLHIYQAALRGMGNAMSPMLSGFGELFMRIAGALLLPALIGYSGIFCAEVLAWVGADIILIPSYYRTLKRELGAGG